jgi:hypothetical protein
MRLNGISRTSAVLGSLAAFWYGSITMVPAGHAGKYAVAMLFSVTLWLLEKTVRQETLRARGLYAVLAGGAVGCMLLEQQDVGLLFGIVAGCYAVFRLIQRFGREWRSWAVCLGPIALVGLLIALPTAISSYDKNISQAASMQSNPKEKWNYITQWSYPPQETLDLVAPGFFGWKSGDAEAPYWGSCGQSAEWETTGRGMRNFRLDCTYAGVIPVLLALLGLIGSLQKRKSGGTARPWVWFWGGMSLILLIFSYGKYSLLYRMFYQLPLVNNIRAPVKFLQIFQIVLGLLCAVGWDYIRTQYADKQLKKRMLLFFAIPAGIFFLGYLGILMSQQDVITMLSRQGWAEAAPLIWKRMYTALLYSTLLLAAAGGVIALPIFRPALVGKKWVWPGMSAVVAVIFLTETAGLTRRYFTYSSYRSLEKGNPVINELQAMQGNERIYFFDSGHVYNQWLAVDGPYHRLNIFNIWQMPRMPGDYRAYLETVGRNMVKVLQLASVKYATAPAGSVGQLPAGAFDTAMYYRFVRDGAGIGVQRIEQPGHAMDQALLKFNSSLSRFTLFPSWMTVAEGEENAAIVSDTFNPQERVIVTANGAAGMLPSVEGEPGRAVPCEGNLDGITADVTVQSDSGGILLFTQHYQPGWRVFVDDREQPLLKCNSISMGVYVPAGTHEVRFACPKKRAGLLIQGAGYLVTALAGLSLLILRFKKGHGGV